MTQEKGLVKATKSSSEIAEIDGYATVFIQSGFFPTLKSRSQAIVKIMAGREMGIEPFNSMRHIHIFTSSGRTNILMQSELMADLIRRSGKYDYTVLEENDDHCRIEWEKKRDGQWIKAGVSEFTRQEAAIAGLLKKDNWIHYRRDMLFARALSRGARRFCADVIHGAYTPDELNYNPEATTPETDLKARIEKARQEQQPDSGEPEIIETKPIELPPLETEPEEPEQKPESKKQKGNTDNEEPTQKQAEKLAEAINKLSEKEGDAADEIIRACMSQCGISEEADITTLNRGDTKALTEILLRQFPALDDTKCAECGKPVSKKVIKYSQEKFGAVYCFDCQRRHNA